MAKGRKIHGSEDEYQLREGQADYGDWQHLDNENTIDWNLANYLATTQGTKTAGGNSNMVFKPGGPSTARDIVLMVMATVPKSP